MCRTTKRDYAFCNVEPPHSYYELFKCEAGQRLPDDQNCGRLEESGVLTASKISCPDCNGVRYLFGPPDPFPAPAPGAWMTANPHPHAQPMNYAAYVHPPPQIVSSEPPPPCHGIIQPIGGNGTAAGILLNHGDGGQIHDEHSAVPVSSQFLEEQGPAANRETEIADARSVAAGESGGNPTSV